MIKEPKKGLYALWFLVLLWFAIHGALLLIFGQRDLFDALRYIREADYIVANGHLGDSAYRFYLTYISVVAFFRALFPGEIYPVIIFQSIFSGIALLLLYKACVKITNDRLAAFFSCLFFLCWWDNIQWNTVLMTESLACSLICLLIYSLSRFQGSVVDFITISILLVLGLFTRPTGIIPIAGVVFFLFAFYWEPIGKAKGLRFFLMACILVMGLFAADEMFFHWNLAENYVQGNIVTYMHSTKGTPLYQPSLQLDPSELVLPPAETRPLLKLLTFIRDNPFHFLKASFLKVWYLLSGVRPYYTKFHNAFTVFWMLVMYVFFFLGWMQLRNNAFRIFVVTVIMMNCLIVAVSTVDWDNRFYIPMEPVIVLVAGLGASSFMKLGSRFLPIK